MKIRIFQDSDWPEWSRMSQALDPASGSAEHEDEMRATLARSDAAVFFAERADGSICGYVEAGSRPYADGCDSSPVGYVEAWYVDPDARLAGYGRALLAAAEEWARSQGYREMASDALLDNVVSFRAHLASGYTEVERVVQFRKPLA